jgi:HEAT repeat protein
VLTAALRDPSPHVRVAVVQAMGRVAEGAPEGVRVLARLLESKRREDRALLPKAAEALGALGAKAEPAFAALIALMADTDGRPRSAAIRALGALVPHSLDELRRILREDRGRARPGAAEACAAAGPAAKKAVPELAAVLGEGGIHDVRNNVYGVALSAIGKPSVRALKKLLSHKNEAVRATAAYALGRIGKDAKSALGSLRRRARDSSRIVSRAAKKAIEQIKGAN